MFKNGCLFAFADSEAEDYFAIHGNREVLYSSGSQPKVTTIPAPFDFHEVANDELRGLKVEYVNSVLLSQAFQDVFVQQIYQKSFVS